MFRERIVWIGLAALVVIGLLFAGGSAMQRSAWVEGYTMGRLTTVGGDGAAAAVAPMMPMAPMAPYAYMYPQHGPGFGGFLFLLIGAGLLFFVVSRFVHRARWQAWAMQGGPQGEWRHGPPWMQHPMGPGCGRGPTPETAPEQKPAAEPKPAAAPPDAAER